MQKAAIAAPPARPGNASDVGGYSGPVPGHESPWIADMLTIFGNLAVEGQPSEATLRVTLKLRTSPEEEH